MRRSQAGMTLVEVVIAAMVLSMLMLGLIAAMRTFASSYEALDAKAQHTSTLREASTFLRHSLRGAVFPSPEALQLTTSELKWRAPLDRVGAAGGVLWFRLVLEDDLLVLHFALPATEESADDPVEPSWDEDIPPQVLLTGVEQLAISAQWDEASQWDAALSQSPTGLPKLLRVELQLQDRIWPPLVVALDAFSEAAR